MATSYSYEKLVDGKLKTANEYTIDHDKSITGKFVVNVKKTCHVIYIYLDILLIANYQFLAYTVKKNF